ncbi:hypothetical protein L6V77_20830 [Myxococcota bacterium]|nr:hypothetical protein [Myxococcota bacterium]
MPLPVSGLAALVGDGENLRPFVVGSVEDGERESREMHAADVGVSDGPPPRRGLDVTDRVAQRGRERVAGLRAAFRVPSDRGNRLCRGVLVEFRRPPVLDNAAGLALARDAA